MSAIGTVIAGMIVARIERRKMKITATTMSVASKSVCSTLFSAPPMKVELSDVTRMWTPGGSDLSSSSTAFVTPEEISSVFDCACRTMPRPMPVWPLMRIELVSSAGPKITSAMSPTRVDLLILIASMSAALLTLASARTSSDWSPAESLPAGTSEATVASAVERSVTESPRAAIAFGSISTRTSGSRSPKTVTSATPSTAERRSTTLSSTSFVRSWIVMFADVTAIRMIASELSSALTIVTSSTSSGSCRSNIADGVAQVVRRDVDVGGIGELDDDAA